MLQTIFKFVYIVCTKKCRPYRIDLTHQGMCKGQRNTKILVSYFSNLYLASSNLNLTDPICLPNLN